jgi:hypothetical protein
MRTTISLGDNIRPILATIKTVPMPAKYPTEQAPPATPFVTVSRQPGAGAWSFAQEFVAAMNASDPAAPQWTCWDRELVEKVAADHHLSEQLIDSLEESDHSWLNDLFMGFGSGSYPDEALVYHRVATTMVALAQAGRVVIVGRGAVFVTRKLPGGIHLRLIAPLEHRIRFIENSMGMTRQQAQAWVADAERKRAAFYKRFWPLESLSPESFTLTVNTAVTSSDELIALVRAFVQHRETHGQRETTFQHAG